MWNKTPLTATTGTLASKGSSGRQNHHSQTVATRRRQLKIGEKYRTPDTFSPAKIGYRLQMRGRAGATCFEPTDHDCEGSHAGMLLRW
jgi:hypothetical protein